MDARQRAYLLDELQAAGYQHKNQTPPSRELVRAKARHDAARKVLRSAERHNDRAHFRKARRVERVLARDAGKIVAVDSYAKGLALVKAFKSRKF